MAFWGYTPHRRVKSMLAFNSHDSDVICHVAAFVIEALAAFRLVFRFVDFHRFERHSRGIPFSEVVRSEAFGHGGRGISH